MDKKIKSSFTQMASDLPNDTDPIGGKINRSFLGYWRQEKEVEKVQVFHNDFSLLELWWASPGPEPHSFSDSPSLYPKRSSNHCCLQPVLTHNTLQSASITHTTQLHQQHQSGWSSSVWCSAPAQPLPSGLLGFWIPACDSTILLLHDQTPVKLPGVLCAALPLPTKGGKHTWLSQNLTPTVFFLSQD